MQLNYTFFFSREDDFFIRLNSFRIIGYIFVRVFKSKEWLLNFMWKVWQNQYVITLLTLMNLFWNVSATNLSKWFAITPAIVHSPCHTRKPWLALFKMTILRLVHWQKHEYYSEREDFNHWSSLPKVNQ